MLENVYVIKLIYLMILILILIIFFCKIVNKIFILYYYKLNRLRFRCKFRCKFRYSNSSNDDVGAASMLNMSLDTTG